MNQSVSAVVLTKNEEKNIERCLESVSWCDEIIIIDDYSEDGTLEKIQNPKSKIQIFKRNLNADFAGQRNFGLEKARGEWVLFVDSDEVITDKLQSEIRAKTQQYAIAQNCVGYYLKRRDFIFGKKLRYGETANVKLLRLARKGNGRWEGRIHEVWKVEGEIGELKNPILHYPHQSITEFLADINWYTDLVAQCWREQGRKMGFWEIIVYPVGKFIQNYLVKLGFLDGTAGLVIAVFMSFHSFLARSKYWLMTNF